MAQPKRTPKITLKKGVSGKPHVVLKGANGEIMMTSESYSSESNAKRAQLRLKEAVKKAAVVTSVSKRKK